MSAVADAVPIPIRIVWRYELEGRGFKVQQNFPVNSNRWSTIDGFTSLLRALRRYPDGIADSGALRRQKQIEEKPHPFEHDNARSEHCYHCGQLKDWQAHGGQR
jgi:hypothetical protein